MSNAAAGAPAPGASGRGGEFLRQITRWGRPGWVWLAVFVCGLSTAAPGTPAVPAAARLPVEIRIVDPEGRPVAAATVEVPSLRLRREADAQGMRVLELPPGEHLMRVRRVGYEPAERSVVVAAGVADPLVFVLQPRPIQAQTVVVRAARGTEPRSDQPGRYTLAGAEVAQQIAGLEDVMRDVQSLPGVGRASDYHGDFYVRGAGSYANAIYLDGIQLTFPYHLLGFNSVFNPGLIESAEFMSGGVPAEYGDATGGVLALHSRGGAPSPERGAVGISYLSAHGRYAWGDARRGGIVSLRRSYQGDVLRWLGADSSGLIPEFHDSFVRMRWQVRPGQQLTVAWLRAGDGLSLPRPQIEAGAFGLLGTDATGSEIFKRLAALHDQLDLHGELQAWIVGSRTVLGSRSYLETTLGTVPQRFDFALAGANTETVSIRSRATTLRADLTWRPPAHRLRAGASWMRDDTARRIAAWSGILTLRESNSSINLVDLKERYDIDAARRRDLLAFYVQDEWEAMPRTTLGGGLRLEHDAWAGESWLDPRATVEVRASDGWSGRWTGGLYHVARDKPMEVQPTTDGQPLGAERSFETSLGASYEGRSPWQGGLAIFMKRMDDVVYEVEPAHYDNGGKVQSRGWETWVRYAPPEGRFRARLTYSWSRTREQDPRAWRRLPDYRASELDEFWKARQETPYWYRPPQDIPHRLGLEAWVHPGKWELGARYELASGRPYTPVRWVATDPLDVRYGVVGEKGSARYPLYQRLDLRVQRTLLRGGVRWILYADIMNATAADNVFQYRYDASYRTRYTVKMLPILPAVGLEAVF